MVQVPKALSPEPYKSPIETPWNREVPGPSPYGPAPLSAEQRDASQLVGSGPTRYPEMPIPDVSPVRVGEFDPQNFTTLRNRRDAILGPAPSTSSQASELMTRLMHTLNSVSAENGSDTPDFILAEYLIGCLRAFDNAVCYRDRWYGRRGAEGGPKDTYIQDDPGEQARADPTDEINDLA